MKLARRRENRVTLEIYDEMPHVFQLLADFGGAGRVAFQRSAEFVSEVTNSVRRPKNHFLVISNNGKEVRDFTEEELIPGRYYVQGKAIEWEE